MGEEMSKPSWKIEAEKWARGELIWSAELGGIGPGYEQAIQILLWEILARWPHETLARNPEAKEYPKEYSEHVEKVVHELDQSCGGFSGAQVSSAQAAAFQFLVYGYNEMMGKLEKDRKILVSKKWPKHNEQTEPFLHPELQA